MDINKQIDQLIGVTESYKAPEKLLEIVLDYHRLKKVALEMLKAHNYKMDYDWFHEYFQSEHADRKNNKQDFTPNSIGNLLIRLNGKTEGIIYEPACGTGGIIIQNWNVAREQYGILHFNPNDRLYICEELTDRTIPFLLFNLALRGVNAIVVQCDALTRKAKAFYHIFNENNDFMEISEVSKIEPFHAKKVLGEFGLVYYLDEEKEGEKIE